MKEKTIKSVYLTEKAFMDVSAKVSAKLVAEDALRIEDPMFSTFLLMAYARLASRMADKLFMREVEECFNQTEPQESEVSDADSD